MENSKELRTNAYAVDRALKSHDARKRLQPNHSAMIEAREFSRSRNHRLRRDKVIPLRDVKKGVDDDYNVDVQRELLDEWAMRAKNAHGDGFPERPPAEAPVEEFVVGLFVEKSKVAVNECYEVVRSCERVVALEDDAEQVPEPHEDWECIEKETRDPPTKSRSYAAVMHDR